MILQTKDQSFSLDPHQLEALEFLRKNDRGALFMEMATQKTITMLLHLYDLIYKNAGASKVLIVAPEKVARLTWVDEITKWKNLEGMRYSLVMGTPTQRLKALQVDAEIYILSVGSIAWLLDLYVKRKTNKHGMLTYNYTGSLPFDVLVIDESSQFKDQGSIRFKKLRKALSLSDVPYRYLLTGTPSPNSLTDLWAQMYLLDEGERLGRTWGEFTDKYFTTRGNGMVIYERKPKKDAQKIITHKISDITLSVQTEDTNMKLPPYILDDILVELDPFDKDIYDLLERDYVLVNIEQNDIDLIAKSGSDLVNKLLQVASGAIYDEGKQWHELNTAKLDALGEILDKYDEPILIVYQFRHEVERILARFPDVQTLPTGKKLRETFEAWNRGEIKRLLIHPASAGHGLNLQHGGSRMVWTSPTWNLEHWLQTLARLRRRGQKAKFITVHRLLANGTRDLKVAQRINSKDKNQDFIMKEIKQLRAKYGKPKRK